MPRGQIFAYAVRALGVSIVLAFSTVAPPLGSVLDTRSELASAVQGKLAALGAVGAA